MSTVEKFTREKIVDIWSWAPNLFSFKTTRNASYKFIPGQFARLGVKKPDGKIVWRAYSIVSASYDEYLEFYSIVVPEGEFTSELSHLTVHDEIYIDKTSYGLLTTARFENGRDLWMLSTGTGLAPFISILYDMATWEQYENLILVHGVRHANELAYQETIQHFAEHEYFKEFAHRLKYVQCVTRETVDGALHGRVTTLIQNGELEKSVDLTLDPENSRVMICGNPEMVEDTRKILLERGLKLSRRGAPGNLAVENLW